MTAFFNSRDGDGYSIREPYVGQVSGQMGQSSEVKFKFCQAKINIRVFMRYSMIVYNSLVP